MTSLGGIKRPVDSDVTEGVITTRSNRMKFRLGCIHVHVCTFSRVHSVRYYNYCEIRIQNSLKCAFLIEQRQLQFIRHFVLPGKNAVFQPPIENF